MSRSSYENTHIKQTKKTKKTKKTKSRPVKTRYGMGQGAELNTEKEKTEDQEYKSGGLPKTEQYAIDKAGDPE